MEFATVRALIGWAFGVEVKSCCSIVRYGAVTGGSELSFLDSKAQAALVMAKINMLPHRERVVVWALHSGLVAHVMALADLVRCDLPLTVRIELVKQWVDGSGKSQRYLADHAKVSQKTVSRRYVEVARQCDELLRSAEAVIEVQCLALIRSLSRANSHRAEKCIDRAA